MSNTGFKAIWMKYLICLILSYQLISATPINFDLDDQGNIPVWLVTGPFDQPISGFGTVGDVQSVDELNLRPQVGQEAHSDLVAGGKIYWISGIK